MPIRVKLYGRLRMVARSDEIELPETPRNVGELLEELIRRTGPETRQCIFNLGTKELSRSLIVLVNGKNVRMLEGLSTPLLEKDAVTVSVGIIITNIVGGG